MMTLEKEPVDLRSIRPKTRSPRSISLPKESWDRIDDLVWQKRVSRSEFFRQALIAYCQQLDLDGSEAAIAALTTEEEEDDETA